MTMKSGIGPNPKICISVAMDILQNSFHSLWLKLFGIERTYSQVPLLMHTDDWSLKVLHQNIHNFIKQTLV